MAQVITFTLALFDALVNDEAFIKKCDGEQKLIMKNMPRPICCWVAAHYPDKLEAAYRELGVEPPDANKIAQLN